MNNICLVVEEKELYVNKDVSLKIKNFNLSLQYLAVQSPYFEKLFFGEFAEKDKDKIPLNDLQYGEFHEFLQFLYRTNKPVDKNNYAYLLKLADCYQANSVICKIQDFLIQTDTLTIAQKLAKADEYNLGIVKEKIIENLTLAGLKKLKTQVERLSFSNELNTLIITKWFTLV